MRKDPILEASGVFCFSLNEQRVPEITGEHCAKQTIVSEFLDKRAKNCDTFLVMSKIIYELRWL